jgi:hypothetical protein
MSGIYTGEFEANCGADISAPSCTTYMTQVEQAIVDAQMNRKNAAIINTIADAQRVFEADKNASFAYIRGQDVLKAQSVVDSVNANQQNSVRRDLDVTKRQFEINEYHYYNKLDTLFFLQVFFISVIVMAILMYFNRRGTLTTKMTGILTGGLAFLLVIVGVSRYFYTSRTRDRRLWHRRYFQSEKKPRDDLITTCPGPSAGTQVNLNALFDKEDITCVQDAKKSYNAWKATVEDEAKSQMAGGVATSIFSNFGIDKPTSCKRK